MNSSNNKGLLKFDYFCSRARPGRDGLNGPNVLELVVEEQGEEQGFV